jgi:hypothetical protein
MAPIITLYHDCPVYLGRKQCVFSVGGNDAIPILKFHLLAIGTSERVPVQDHSSARKCAPKGICLHALHLGRKWEVDALALWSGIASLKAPPFFLD